VTVQDVTNKLSKVQEKLYPLDDSVSSPRGNLEQMEFKDPELFDPYGGEINKRSQSMNNADITKGISFNKERTITDDPSNSNSIEAIAVEEKLDFSNLSLKSVKREKNNIDSTLGYMKIDIKDQCKIAKDQIN
jgi:hypothetical protein